MLGQHQIDLFRQTVFSFGQKISFKVGIIKTKKATHFFFLFPSFPFSWLCDFRAFRAQKFWPFFTQMVANFVRFVFRKKSAKSYRLREN